MYNRQVAKAKSKKRHLDFVIWNIILVINVHFIMSYKRLSCASFVNIASRLVLLNCNIYSYTFVRLHQHHYHKLEYIGNDYKKYIITLTSFSSI